MINEGWVCPKCGRVLAPNTMYCLWCCSGRGATTNTASGTPESYLAKSLRYSQDGHEIAKTENSSEKPTSSTISKMEQVDEPQITMDCSKCERYKDGGELCDFCAIKDEPQTDTEIAKAIVHKMIDDAVIAEDAYPDLRQKMHDAVDEYEPQTERSE